MYMIYRDVLILAQENFEIYLLDECGGGIETSLLFAHVQAVVRPRWFFWSTGCPEVLGSTWKMPIFEKGIFIILLSLYFKN